MARARKKVNVPDIVIGVVLIAAIPLITLACLPSDSPETAAAAGGPADPKVLPLGPEELNELKAEYIRMYQQNARLFLQRSIDSQTQDRERGWAKQVLLRAQKGLTELKARIKAAHRFDEALPEIERYLKDIDTELRALPAAAASGAPAPLAPVPASAPAAAAPPAAAPAAPAK